MVSGRYARQRRALLRKRPDVRRVPLVDALGREGVLHRKVVVLLLVPEEGRLVSVHAQPHAVLLPCRDLRDDERRLRAAGEPEEHGRVVVEPVAGREGREVGDHLLHLEPRHVLDEVEAVHSDVRHHAARARLPRVHLPRIALVERLGEVDLAERSLLVLEDYLVYPAELSRGDDVARELDHREARVGERDAENAAPAPRYRAEFLRLREGHRERLLAHHVEARLERGLRDLVVRVVRRADGDEVRFSAAPLDERAPVVGVRVASVDKVREVVHPYRHAVDGSDERSLPPAYHCVLEPPAGVRLFHAVIIPNSASARSGGCILSYIPKFRRIW